MRIPRARKAGCSYVFAILALQFSSKRVDQMLKKIFAFSLVVAAYSASYASEPNSSDCLLLQKDLEKRFSVNSDTDFELIIYDSGVDVEGKQVGTCMAGKKKIIYVEYPPS